MGVLEANSADNARYILSALGQAQAAIFGIFFTLNFIIFQTQIANVSPGSIKRQLLSFKLVFIFIIYIISILLDFILIRYSETAKINIFWPLSLSVFAVLILLPYMRITLLELVKEAIVMEILNGRARRNLSGVDLSDTDLRRAKLNNRNLRFSNLSGAILFYAKLNKTDFFESNLSNARLENAQLIRSNLINCNLSNAHFNNANLNGAELFNCNLSSADFTGSDLRGTYLTDSYGSCCLRGIKYDKTIITYLLDNIEDFNTIEFLDDELKGDMENEVKNLLSATNIHHNFIKKLRSWDEFFRSRNNSEESEHHT